MVRGHDFLAEALSQMKRDALRHAARVHEDQRGAMLAREIGEAIVNLAPHFVRGYGAQFARGNFDGEIEFAAIPHLDDFRLRQRLGAVGPGQKFGDQLDGILRGGKADSRGRLEGEAFEALE